MPNTTPNLEATSSYQNENDLVASRYLNYLPQLYRQDDFLGRFLLIFESVLGPLEAQIGQLEQLFDPYRVPADFLPWLASWLGLVLDQNWPLSQRRQLVAEATHLYRWRGTKRGMTRYLELYTGFRPVINDTEGNENVFVVSFELTQTALTTFNEARVRQIIESEKPAASSYILEVRW